MEYLSHLMRTWLRKLKNKSTEYSTREVLSRVEDNKTWKTLCKTEVGGDGNNVRRKSQLQELVREGALCQNHMTNLNENT